MPARPELSQGKEKKEELDRTPVRFFALIHLPGLNSALADLSCKGVCVCGGGSFDGI